MKRILYVQYTNPAGYPPLEHSSRILAEAGWKVLFLGTGAAGADSLRLPTHANIMVKRMAFCPAGWRQKLHYLYFCLWVLFRALTWRPQWIYVSDAMACPIGLALDYVPGTHTVYHEHDSPNAADAGRNGFTRFLFWARRTLARRAELYVLPNQRRLKHFNEEIALKRGLCVWNCPRRDEVAAERRSVDVDRVWLIYHGSLVPERLPLTVLDAMKLLPDSVSLRVIGYETVGSRGYMAAFREHAISLGILMRIEFAGPLARAELLAQCRRSDIGLALTPMVTSEINYISMIGASNKAFDYMASGLAVVVSDLPDWREMYVDEGYALACDPGVPASIAAAVRCLLEDPERRVDIGDRGRQQILSAWNYETQFQPVLETLNGRF